MRPNENCLIYVSVILCFTIGCGDNATVNSSRAGKTASEVNYAALVGIGTKAQAITPIKNRTNLEERKRFVESGQSLCDQLRIVLQNEVTVCEELRPHRYEARYQDTFLHFKPLAILIRESGRLAAEEKNTHLVLQNASLLINLGKSICFGGDSDDQTIGFIFVVQGTASLYQYIQTQPNDLGDSAADIFANLKESIESGTATISRLPEHDERRHELVYEKAVEIQSNRVFVVMACLEMCRIAYELEQSRQALGEYPLSLQEGIGLPVLSTDPWGESYVYHCHGDSYRLYSKGIGKVDDGSDAPDISISTLVTTSQGIIDLGRMK